LAAPFFYRLNRLARAVSRCRLRFLTDRRQRFIAGSPCVVAPSEFLQHFVKVRGGEYEQPLVLVEHHGRNLAHAHDVAEMRFHVRVGLGPLSGDLMVGGFGLPGRRLLMNTVTTASGAPI
jgi:hypothetical protein